MDRSTPVTDPVHLTVEAAYDRWADSYDGYDNPMVFAAGEALARRLPEAAHGRDCVEIGCGTGRNLAVLAKAGTRSLWGCDLSEGMLDRARARKSGARLVRADMAGPLPLEAASADFVLVSLAFEHVADLDPPMAEIVRVLRPGGRLLIQEIHPFMAMGGVGAHFTDGEGAVRMPTVAHAVSDHLNAIAGAGLRLTGCREWRGGDFGPGAPRKLLKRGPDFPILIEFEAERADVTRLAPAAPT